MRTVLAASVAILALGAATGVIAEADGGGMPVIAADSGASDDTWGVASSAGLTYDQSAGPAAGALLDAATGQTVLQNYQVLGPNVIEFTQVVSGDVVTTLSGVMLEKNGDDTTDAAALDEEASGVYSSGSAGLVPSQYGGEVTAANGFLLECALDCQPPSAGAGPSGDAGAVKTLASYASNADSNSFGSLAYGPPIYSNPLDYGFPPPGPGSLGGPFIPPLPYLPPPQTQPGGNPPPTTPPPGPPPNGVGGGGPGPVIDVPEPGAWGLMLIGLGLVGAARRRVVARIA